MPTPYSHIKVNPKSNDFGAEIRGADLTQTLSQESLSEITHAWQKHSVIYFPDQVLNHQQLENFTLSIGDFGFDPYIEPLNNHPHILELRREADEKATNFGAAWHSDWSFQAQPPSATILHAKEIPPVGGDTLFADGYRAYDSLSETMKNLLSSLNAIHSAGFAYSTRGILAAEEKERSMKINFSEEAEASQTHPLIRKHPQSGRKAIFVNPVYTTGIEGMNQDESFLILSFLYQLLAKDALIYRHQWQANTLLMWDNRCVNHLAEGGYDGYRRVMHRTTVCGETPQRA